LDSSICSRPRSARSLSRCELTDTYSPTAMEPAPATTAAVPAVSTALRDAPEATTPIIRLATETMPSSAPRTAARSQLARPPRCLSLIAIPISAPCRAHGHNRKARTTIHRAAWPDVPRCAGRIRECRPLSKVPALEVAIRVGRTLSASSGSPIVRRAAMSQFRAPSRTGGDTVT
jgi:hypothetical protein